MEKSAGRDHVARVLNALHLVEDTTLALLLGTMILLAPLQILLRNFFNTSIPWADPLIRVLVLWVGLLGAVAASRGNRHITVDVLSRVLSGRARAAVGVVIGLFTTIVSGLVAFHSGHFVASEFSYHSIAFSSIPAWSCEIVIPFAFGVMALRYLFFSISDMAILLGLRKEPEK